MALAAKDEAELLKLEYKLNMADSPHRAVREPDPPWDGELMAIGISPIDRDQIKKFVKKYPLVK